MDYSKKDNAITTAIIALYCLDLVLYFHVPSVAVFKSFLLLLEALVFLVYMNSKGKVRHNRIDTAISVYLILLTIRLVIDFGLKGITFFVYQHTITIFVFFTGLAIIPFLFFSNIKVNINAKLFLISVYFALIGALTLSLEHIVLGVAEASTSDRFAGEGGFSILYGHLGVSLFFVSLCLHYVELSRIVRVLMQFVGILIGLLSMIYSGSRGPFVAFLVLSVLFFFVNAKNRAWKSGVVIVLSLLAVFFKSILTGINNLLRSFDILSFNRVYHTFVVSDGDGTSGRDVYFMNAINDFLENPIFGKAYLLDNGSYCHNIFIEQFRATGIIGGVLFLVFTLYALRKGYRAFKVHKEVLILYLLFVQYVVYGCFSSSIIAIPQYWIGLYVVLNYIKQYNGTSISNHPNLRLQGAS